MKTPSISSATKSRRCLPGLLLLLLAAASARAGIMTTGDLTGSGTPYNGTDDPWVTGSLTIGNTASGTLTINGGSVVNNGGAGVIAKTAGASTSAVTVTGAGSQFNNTAQLTVGQSGTATLTITNGGTVTNTGASIGLSSGSNGTMTVGGGVGTSTWTSANILTVGTNATGVLNIIGGGVVTTGSNLSSTIGVNAAGNGTVTVGTGTGTGAATWTLTGGINVGFNGVGVLNLNTGGTVTAARLDGGNPVGSKVNFDGGTLNITANDTATNKFILLSGGATFDISTAATTFSLTGSAGQISGAGGFTKTGQATLSLGLAASYGGDTTVDFGTLSTNSAYLNDSADVFIHTGGKFALDTAGASDTIDKLWLGGVQVASGTWGSSSSLAAHVNDTFFSGTGMLDVTTAPSAVPEPATLAVGLLCLGAGMARRRRSAVRE